MQFLSCDVGGALVRALGGGLEALAAADRRHFQVKWRETRMPALFDQAFRSLMLETNLDHLLVKVLLAKMNAQAALAGLDLLHSGGSLSFSGGRISHPCAGFHKAALA